MSGANPTAKSTTGTGFKQHPHPAVAATKARAKPAAGATTQEKASHQAVAAALGGEVPHGTMIGGIKSGGQPLARLHQTYKKEALFQ